MASICFMFKFRATTDIYPLSLHDALPICLIISAEGEILTNYHVVKDAREIIVKLADRRQLKRSEEHTSELQSRENLVCRLLLEKKTNAIKITTKSSNVLSRAGKITINMIL